MSETRRAVQVTQAHINAADHGSCDRCPIALAVGDVVGTPYRVVVSRMINVRDRATSELLFQSGGSLAVQQFIVDWDNLNKPYLCPLPFTFQLTLPSELWKEQP